MQGLIAQERQRADLIRARHDWTARRQPPMRTAPHRLVFIDETSVKANMTRLRGRSPVGKRLFSTAPFDTYIETQLAPTPDPGTVVILDNLATHKSPRAAEALKACGCWLLYLPAYSPDLNPIEMAFSKLKTHLRRIEARTFDQLIKAPGSICSLFEPNESWNFFKADGYASD